MSITEHLRTLCRRSSDQFRILMLTAQDFVTMATDVVQISSHIASFNVEDKPSHALGPGIDVIAAVVTTIVPDRKVIITSTGTEIAYDYLCIATGAVPKLIFPDNEHIIGLRDTTTALELERRITGASKIMVVGNGGIAMELVHAIKSCDVVWVLKDKHIGAAYLDEISSSFLLPHAFKPQKEDQITEDLGYIVPTPLKRWRFRRVVPEDSKESTAVGSSLGPDWSELLTAHKTGNGHNLEMIYGCEVTRVDASEEGVHVTLTNGQVCTCDFLVSATGVVPAAFFNGVTFDLGADGGINVDDQFQTSVPDIYAAGDVCCANWKREPDGQWFQMRLWTQARQMGLACAQSLFFRISGKGPQPLDICFELFTHVTQFFGYKVVLLGLFNGQGLGSDYHLLIRETPPILNAHTATTNGAAEYNEDASNISQSNESNFSKPLHPDDAARAPASTAMNDATPTPDGSSYHIREGNQSVGSQGHFVKLVIHNNRVFGAVLIGETDLEETIENLILNGTDVSMYGDELLGSNVDIEDYFD